MGGSFGDRGDDPNPVSEDGGVIEAMDASMAAVPGGVTGGAVGVMLPSLPPLPTIPATEGLGLVIPELGGLILFSFWRLSTKKSLNYNVL